MYGTAVENSDFPIPGRTQWFSQGDCEADPELKSISLHRRIRSDGSKFQVEINKTYHEIHKITNENKQHAEKIREQKSSRERASKRLAELHVVKKYNKSVREDRRMLELEKCADHVKECDGTIRYLEHKHRNNIKRQTELVKTYDKIVRDAMRMELKTTDIIFCTMSMSMSPRLLETCRGKIFQLIIDEAAMCTEPQSIAAIIATNAKHVVLVGDHKQLQPVIQTRDASNLGMRKSLFERYATRASFLKYQYRMVCIQSFNKDTTI